MDAYSRPVDQIREIGIRAIEALFASLIRRLTDACPNKQLLQAASSPSPACRIVLVW